MSIDDAKKILLNSRFGGLFIYRFEIESSSDNRFLYLLGSNIASVYHNSEISERKFGHGELIKYLNSESFWALNDFECDQVFDGDEYLVIFKNRDGDSKILHLMNPEYSESMEFQKLISLIESEVFPKPS